MSEALLQKVNHYQREIVDRLDRYSTVNRRIKNGRRMIAGLMVENVNKHIDGQVEPIHFNRVVWITGQGKRKFVCKRTKGIAMREETPEATKKMFSYLNAIVSHYINKYNIPNGHVGDIRIK